MPFPTVLFFSKKKKMFKNLNFKNTKKSVHSSELLVILFIIFDNMINNYKNFTKSDLSSTDTTALLSNEIKMNPYIIVI